MRSTRLALGAGVCCLLLLACTGTSSPATEAATSPVASSSASTPATPAGRVTVARPPGSRRPRPSATAAVSLGSPWRITVLNDTAGRATVRCGACGEAGFVLAPRGRRQVDSRVGDEFFVVRPGRTSCTGLSLPFSDGPAPSRVPDGVIRVSQVVGSCPSR